MKKGLRYFAMLVLLVCLLILCTTQMACAKIDGQLQALSAPGKGASVQVEDAQRVEALTALIVMYSEQLEEYDRSNGSFVVACVGFAGAVLSLAINLFISKKEQGMQKRPDYRMAALFSLIPGVAALCLYVFSMQCRRVVFFRGYLSYLEEQLGQLTGIPMVFNSHVVTRFFGEFNTMNAGFAVMGITVFAMLVVSFSLCIYFVVPKGAFSKFKLWNEIKACFLEKSHIIVGLFIILIVAVFSFSCVVCVIDLCSNGDIPNSVHNFCKQFLP